MKYTSALISDARNKLGGDVFARNRAGLYVRVKVQPANPRTPAQQSNRAQFSSLTKAWRSLSSAQILGWNTLAGSSTLVDTLGNSFAPSGIQLFIGCNRNRTLLGYGILVVAPAQVPPMPALVAYDVILSVFVGSGLQLNYYAIASQVSFMTGIVGYLAGPLSAGVSFVGGSLYRFMGEYGTIVSNRMLWVAGPTAYFGTPAAGSIFAWKFKYIDGATGYAGPVTTGFVTVTPG